MEKMTEHRTIKLAPSILSADFALLGEEVKRVAEAGADYIHIDVMDGSFVPSISFGFPIIRAVRKVTEIPLDVHLMIDEPIRYIDEFVEAGADIITVHYESCKHLNRTLQAIRGKGVRAGVAINPATPLTVLEYVLEDVDMILLMSVNPGFGGQAYIPNTTEKIRKLRKILDDRALTVEIEVDGGISLQNVCEVTQAGADVLVAGSAVFNNEREKNVRAFKEAFS